MVKRFTYLYNRCGELERCEEQYGDYVLHSDYVALEARHAALREAVAWERESDATHKWTDRYRVWPACIEAERLHDCARAEVDRLMGGEES